MCERLLRQSVCLQSQSTPRKLCVDDELLDSLVLVRSGAAIAEGASQPRREKYSFQLKFLETGGGLHAQISGIPGLFRKLKNVFVLHTFSALFFFLVNSEKIHLQLKLRKLDLPLNVI